MTYKNKTYRNVTITSILTIILISSGIGLAAAQYDIPLIPIETEPILRDNTFGGSNTFGETIGVNANMASGEDAAAFGLATTASAPNSVAFGDSSVANGYASTAFGDATITTGDFAVAIGQSTTAQPYASFVIGSNNEISGTTNSWIATEPLFVIGNGASAASPNNALTVLKNGNMGIGISSPNSDLQIANSSGNGYLQLDTISGTSPPIGECQIADVGRMIVDDSLPYLYVCQNIGGVPTWIIH